MSKLVKIGSHIASAALFATAAICFSLPSAAETISFEGDVIPILQVRCIECHQPGGDGYGESGLDLTSYEGVMKGTKHGPIVVPGNAIMSNLMVLVDGRADEAIRMPHERKKLTKCEISILRRWVNAGAKDN
jgi:Planctomycete cytochrome C